MRRRFAPRGTWVPLVILVLLAVASRFAALTGLAVSQATADFSASVSGTVVDQDGRALGGATVTLGRRPGGRPGASAAPPASEVTDRDGSFLFTRLPPGDGYTISATKQGYFDAIGSVNGAAAIRLTSSGWVRGLTLVLHHHSSISGIVVSDSGEPMVRVAVQAFKQVQLAASTRFAAVTSTLTDDRGAYYLSALPSGHYAVAAFIPPKPGTERPSRDLRAAIYPRVFFPDAATVATSGDVAVGSSEQRTGVTITMHREESVTILEHPLGLDSDSTPATLFLIPAGDEELGLYGVVSRASGTAADGVRFDPIPRGRYTVLAAPGLSSLSFAPTGASPAPLLTSIGPTPLDFFVPAGVTREGVLQLHHTTVATVSASTCWGHSTIDASGLRSEQRITLEPCASISGRVRDEAGNAPGDLAALAARAFLDPADGEVMRGMQVGTLSNGTLSATAVPPGRYFIRVGVPAKLVSSIMWNGREMRDQAFDLEPGHSLTDIEVNLTGRTGEIRGRLVAPSGSTSVSSLIVAFPAALDRSALGLHPAIYTAWSDGPAFSIRFLPAGEYYVSLARPNEEALLASTALLDDLANRGLKVSVKWGESATINLPVR